MAQSRSPLFKLSVLSHRMMPKSNTIQYGLQSTSVKMTAELRREPMDALSQVGTAAAVCTTGSFIPQIVKIKKQGGEDLSYAMLVFYLTGVLLWLAYGLRLHAPAVIWANGATAFLVVVALVLKAA